MDPSDQLPLGGDESFFTYSGGTPDDDADESGWGAEATPGSDGQSRRSGEQQDHIAREDRDGVILRPTLAQVVTIHVDDRPRRPRRVSGHVLGTRHDAGRA